MIKICAHTMYVRIFVILIFYDELLLPPCVVDVVGMLSDHGSSVYVCRDGGGCSYTVIQRKASATVLQGLKTANGTSEEKVQTTHQTALTVLRHEHKPAHGNRLRHFPRFIFFF